MFSSGSSTWGHPPPHFHLHWIIRRYRYTPRSKYVCACTIPNTYRTYDLTLVQPVRHRGLPRLLDVNRNGARVRELTSHLVSLLVSAAEDTLPGPALDKLLGTHLLVLTRTEQLTACATSIHHRQELSHTPLSPGNGGPQLREVDVAVFVGEAIQETEEAGDLSIIQLVSGTALGFLDALFKRTASDPLQGPLQGVGTQRTVSGEETDSAQLARRVQWARLLLLLVTVWEQAPLEAAVAEDGLLASREARDGSLPASGHNLSHVAVPDTVVGVWEHNLLQAVKVERRGIGIQQTIAENAEHCMLPLWGSQESCPIFHE